MRMKDVGYEASGDGLLVATESSAQREARGASITTEKPEDSDMRIR